MTKDYLHSDLLQDKANDRVFQKTYGTIDKFARKLTNMEAHAFGIKDAETIATMEKINAEFFSDEIIELVNYTIQHFRKNKRI